jgi:uncharacterized protein (TIGR02453 family)
MPKSLQGTLSFLEDLRFNNNKTWFDENRKRYEAAKSAVEALIEEIIQQFSPVENLGKLTPKECMFRINRDVRFSKDKSPYKTNFGVVIGRGGRKSTERSYYLNIEPGDGFIAAGVYDPSPEQLKTLRDAIATKPKTFEKIITAPDFVKYFGSIRGEKLKTVPKGFSPDHPAIELLKHKQFLAVHPLKDKDLLRDNFAAYFVEVCAALKPFEDYFYQIRLKSGQ